MEDRNWIFFIELMVFSGAAIAFGLWELYKLRQDRKAQESRQDSDEDAPDPMDGGG